MPSINFNVDITGDALQRLAQYSSNMRSKMNEICSKLAKIGAVKASLGFSRSIYDGRKDFSVSVEPLGNGYVIKADGDSVLFLEFGAGVTYGYGHPQASEFGMGPGTYNPTSNNWKNPHGWWMPSGQHTYGNPPNMPMYNTAKDLEKEVQRVVEEVLKT